MDDPASQRISPSLKPEKPALTKDLPEQSLEAETQDIFGVFVQFLSLIDQELLKQRIQSLLEKNPPVSKLQRLRDLSVNPMAVVLVSFLLTGILGTHVSYLYGLKQQEATRQRSSSEIDLERLRKIGEVWEVLDKNEGMLDSFLDRSGKAPNLSAEEFEQVARLVDEDVGIVNKNRFWLGEEIYGRFKDYLEITGRIIINMMSGQTRSELEDAIKKRDQAKQNIQQIRETFFKGTSQMP
jgi:hypothetical protein